MQEVIVGETESVLYRSNQSPESTYHVLAFLNQMVFSSERHEVPTRLMNLYFGFFSAEVAKRKKQLNQKILLALLTGVNRAFPFAKRDENDAISENMDQLYKLVHHGTFIVGLQSLSLLYQGKLIIFSHMFSTVIFSSEYEWGARWPVLQRCLQSYPAPRAACWNKTIPDVVKSNLSNSFVRCEHVPSKELYQAITNGGNDVENTIPSSCFGPRR